MSKPPGLCASCKAVPRVPQQSYCRRCKRDRDQARRTVDPAAPVMTIDQIGAALGMPRQTVYRLLRSAMAKVQVAMRDAP